MIGVGDLVVCVDDSPCKCCGGRPPYALRAHYRVTGFYPGNEKFLVFAQVNPEWLSPECRQHQGHNPARFRPLNDSNDDAELIERIKSCKPVEVPAAEIDFQRKCAAVLQWLRDTRRVDL